MHVVILSCYYTHATMDILHDTAFLASCIKKHKQVQFNHFSSLYLLLKLRELRYSVEKHKVFTTSPDLEYTGVKKQTTKQHKTNPQNFSMKK